MLGFFKQKDKRDHLVYSAFIFLTFFMLLRESYIYASLITIVIGVGKEIYDKNTPGRECDIKDVIADALGILLGIMICYIGKLHFSFFS